MIYSYEDYLKENKETLSFEECKKLHEQMILDIGRDEEAIEYYEDIVEKASEYVQMRCMWFIKDSDWRRDNDELRSAKHNRLLLAMKVLVNYLRTLDKKAEWGTVLVEDKNNPYSRKQIGDFACYLVYVHGINAR